MKVGYDWIYISHWQAMVPVGQQVKPWGAASL